MYPASFQSTGSGSLPGWGDIKGVISKLDYFKHLGVDVVWLSPIYKSPQVDMGYDIADYKDIDPRYGTLEDVDELIAGLHKRDMKLMMDLVVNHTSDQHDWFLKSRSSKDDPKRSWYHWQPPKYDEHGNRQPPNNWAMILGEAHSAWTWRGATLAVTEMQPTPPMAMKPSAMSSLPDNWMKSRPQASRCAVTRARSPVASLTPTMVGMEARRAMVAVPMSATVRPGTL